MWYSSGIKPRRHRILTDEATWKELWPELISVDPLGFEQYPERLVAARKKAGTSDAIFTGLARLEGMPLHLGVMNFRFMGGSMGSVVGEKIARLARRSADKKIPMILFVPPVAPDAGRSILMQMQKRRRHCPDEQVHSIITPSDPTTAASLPRLQSGICHPAEPAAGSTRCQRFIKRQLAGPPTLQTAIPT